MSLITSLVDGYNHYIHEKSDPGLSQYFLVGSPVSLTIILAVYYLFCTKYGPQFMSGREPYNVEKLMMAYNLSQVIMNAVFVYRAFITIWLPGHYDLICQMPKHDKIDDFIMQNVYLFFICRLFDLFDTVFMVFRKKFKQITFLHIYHHLMVSLLVWHSTKYMPGGHGLLFGTMNAFVHTIMYAYYFITALFPQHKENMWWKKHITELQLIQFIVVVVQNVIALCTPTCEYPRILLYLYLSQGMFMLYLFSKFYFNTYLKPRKNKNK